MSKPDEPLPSLETLQRKIDEAKSREDRKQDRVSGTLPGYGQATQMATEMVAGAGVGSFCGYYLDHWLGISPICLILGFLIGFAAGVRNLLRTAGKDAERKDNT